MNEQVENIKDEGLSDQTGPNDIIIRLTKDENGNTQYAFFLGVSNDALVPEMQQTVDFLDRALQAYSKTGAELEYGAAINFADSITLAKPKGRVILPKH